MPSATIRIFLVHGDAKRLRTAELSNWTGKAVAAPRNEFDGLISREEATGSGVYFLTGSDPETGRNAVYVGEAESIRDRLKSHLERDFWNHVIFFVSKDENLTKAHIRFLEGRLIEQAKLAARSVVTNNQGSGARLPESDREDMEIFLEKIHQLLPALGADFLVATTVQQHATPKKDILTYELKGNRHRLSRRSILLRAVAGRCTIMPRRPRTRTSGCIMPPHLSIHTKDDTMPSSIRTCLWFHDGRGREAAAFYCALIPGSRIEATYDISGDGASWLIDFTLGGVPYQILDAGPMFTLSEAVSISVETDDQAQTDRLWAALTANGGEESHCGWLKDRYGVSWQVFPRRLTELTLRADRDVTAKAMAAMMKQRKIDIAEIEAAVRA